MTDGQGKHFISTNTNNSWKGKYIQYFNLLKGTFRVYYQKLFWPFNLNVLLPQSTMQRVVTFSYVTFFGPNNNKTAASYMRRAVHRQPELGTVIYPKMDSLEIKVGIQQCPPQINWQYQIFTE